MAIEAAKKEKQYAKQEKDQLEQQYDLNKKEIQNAFEELKESLESMPSTTKLAGLSVQRTLFHLQSLSSLYQPIF
jgi:ABC-type phosphate transport system auxiliary subunit